MTLPKNSQALKCYRLGLGCREHPAVVISDIARADGVSTEEAERRYAKAKEQHSKRAAAQFTRGLRQRGALESMRGRFSAGVMRRMHRCLMVRTLCQ